MFKLIVSDLDETLISSTGDVSKENIDAIKRAQAEGIRFIPATGRSFNDFQHILKMLDVYDKEDEFSISYNGGVITENKGNRLITTKQLPFDIVEEIVAISNVHKVLIHVFTLSDIYTYRMNDNEAAYLDGHITLTELAAPSVKHLRDTPILKINFQHLNNEFLREIESSLNDELKNALDINYSSNRYLEFNPRGVNKGNALNQLLQVLNLTPDQVLAIGDNMNDRTMIELAGTGVAVANAVDELKSVATYNSPFSHNHHAVAETINKFIFK